MKRQRLLLGFLLVALCMDSCTVQIPLSRETQKLHDGAQVVTPYYQIKSKSARAKRAVWLYPLLAGVVGGGASYFLRPKDSNGLPYTDAQRLRIAQNGSIYGGAAGLYVGCMTFLLNHREVTQRTVEPNQFGSWMSDYGRQNNTSFVRVGGNTTPYLIVPRRQLSAYERTEQETRDKAERDRREAEEQARRVAELVAYNQIMSGDPADIDAYLTIYPDGVHYAEIKALAPVYRAYLTARKGQLADSRAYLSNPANTFMRHRISRRATLLETYANNAPQRRQALNAFYGINTAINPDECRRILTQLATRDDDMAKLWQGIFTYLGTGGYTPDEETGLALIEQYGGSEIVQNAFQSGDNEAIYAIAFVDMLGSASTSHAKANELFNRLANQSQYAPAQYMAGVLDYQRGNFTAAHQKLTKAQQLGVAKAATALGLLYQKEDFAQRNRAAAIKWFTHGFDAGDVDAAVKLAQLYENGDATTQPDAPQALTWATKAAETGNTNALIYLGKFYADSHQGVNQDTKLALRYFTQAAEKGDREAMFLLGALALEGKWQGFKDEKQARFWVQKATEATQPQAMALLGKFYSEGELIERSIIKSRYWLNQAKLRGVGRGSYQPKSESPVESILKFGDFSPTYTVTSDYYTGREISRTENLGSGMIGGIISGMFGSFFDRQTNLQDVIDGLEFIQMKGKKRIYAGTLMNQFRTELTVKRGQTLHFNCSGIVNTGSMSGNSDPDGLVSWQEYNVATGIRHGAVMGNIGQTGWFTIGSDRTMAVSQDGVLYLGVNDVGSRDNRGYYDMRLELTEP